MKGKIRIPKPAKAIYAVYLGSLAVILHAGFFFLSTRSPREEGVSKLSA